MYQGYEKDYGTPLDIEGPVALYKKINKPPIKWLIQDILKEKGIGVLYGSSGAMKSYSAVDLACRMVNGMDFHGKPMQKKNVIYIAGEAVEETAERIDGECEYYHLEERPIIVPWAIQLHEPDQMTALKTVMARTPDVGLVIFDNLADCTAGLKLSDPDEVGEKLKPALLSFVNETKCAVLLLHHTGHNPDHERGARVLRDMSDTTIKATKERNNFDLTWKREKIRRMGTQPDLSFHIEDISQVVDIDNIAIIKTGKRNGSVDIETGEILDSETPENVTEFRNVSDRLKFYVEECDGRVSVDAVIDYFEWRRDNGKPKQTYYDALKGLAGVVEKQGNDLILVPNDGLDFGTAAD